MKQVLQVLLLSVVILAVGISAGAKSTKPTERGWLGIYTQPVDYDLSKARDLGVKYGAVIIQIAEDSPAEQAGLKKDDIIIALNREKVTDTDDLVYLLEKHQPGDNITLTISRGDERENIDVTLGEKPEDSDFHTRANSSDDEDVFFDFKWNERGYLGVTLVDLTEQLGEYFGVKDGEGALVSSVEEDSPAEKAGLKAGDVIVAVDGEQIENSEDVSELISDHEKGDKVEITVVRNNRRTQVTAELEETKSGFPGMFSFHHPRNSFRFKGIPDADVREKGLDEILKNLKGLKIKLKNSGDISSGDDEDDETSKEIEITLQDDDDHVLDMDALQELRKEIQKMKKELQEMKKKLQ